MSNALASLAALRQQLALSPSATRRSNLVQGLSVGSYLPQLTIGSRGFAVRAGEEPQMLLDAQRRPMMDLELVIAYVSPFVSRAYYMRAYDPANQTPPDCTSIRGDVPDPGSPHVQHETCAGCPMAEWGSSSREGSRAKACRETKRLVMVAPGDLECRVFGAPFLFVVPPGSLNRLIDLHRKLAAIELPEWAIVVRMGFDGSKQYPAVNFEVERALDMQEIARIWAIRRDFAGPINLSFGLTDNDTGLQEEPPDSVKPLLDRIPPSDPVSEPEPVAKTAPEPKPKPKPMAKTAPEPKLKPKPEPEPKSKPEPMAKVASAPEPEPSPWDDVDEDIEEEDEDPQKIFAKMRR